MQYITDASRERRSRNLYFMSGFRHSSAYFACYQFVVGTLPSDSRYHGAFFSCHELHTYLPHSINFIAMSPSLHVTHHKNITASHPSFLWIFFCTKNNCFYFLKYSNKILTRFNECRASLCLESNPILFFLVAQDSINYKCIFS